MLISSRLKVVDEFDMNLIRFCSCVCLVLEDYFNINEMGLFFNGNVLGVCVL